MIILFFNSNCFYYIFVHFKQLDKIDEILLAKLKKDGFQSLNYIQDFRKLVHTLDSYDAIESNITLDEFVNSPFKLKDKVDNVNVNDNDEQQQQQQLIVT